MFRFNLKVSILAACLFLISCQSSSVTNPTLIEDLVSAETCERPCWQGIEPGISTADEVESVLSSLSNVDQDSIERTSWIGKAGYESISWTMIGDPHADDSGVAYVRSDGVIEDMYVDPVGELVLRDLIDAVGPPDYYRTSVIELPRTPGGWVIWLEEGLEVTVLAERSTRRSITIGPASVIYSLHYFTLMPSLKEYLTFYFGYTDDEVRSALESYQEWSSLEGQ